MQTMKTRVGRVQLVVKNVRSIKQWLAPREWQVSFHIPHEDSIMEWHYEQPNMVTLMECAEGLDQLFFRQFHKS